MIKYLLGLFLLLAGCGVLEDGVPADALRVTNRSSVAILPLAIERERSYLIDIAPPPLVYFEENKVESGHSIDFKEVDGYKRGDDIVLFVWRESSGEEEHLFSTENEVFAVDYYEYGNEVLRELNYRIVIED